MLGRGEAGAADRDYARVVLPHLDAGYNLARWLTRDATLAQDVVQQAALRALRYFASFRGGDGRAWFLQIVRRAAHEALAGRPAFAELQAAEGCADPAEGPEAVVARREREATLAARLAAMPIELRECLVLRELEELSYRDIAGIIGAPVGTVMSRLWRARQLLMDQREGAR